MHIRYYWGGIRDFDCPEIHLPINIKYFPSSIHTSGRLSSVTTPACLFCPHREKKPWWRYQHHIEQLQFKH